jgi:HSP20 family protein
MLQTVYYDPLRAFAAQSGRRKIADIETHAGKDGYWRPDADIVESSDQYRLYLDLPGIDPQQIEVTEEKNVLTVKAQRSVIKSEQHQKVTRTERKSGEYKRLFTLPEDADVEAIRAESKNGVLELTIKRKQAEDTLRKIEVTQ